MYLGPKYAWGQSDLRAKLGEPFDHYYIGQIYGGDFAKFYGLLRIYELYLT